MPYGPGGPPGETGVACSAVPEDLLRYSASAVGDDRTLDKTGQHVSDALDRFAASNPDPSILGTVPRLGDQLSGFVDGKIGDDDWVGHVGRAFAQAGNGASPLGVIDTTSDQVDAWLTVDGSWDTNASADELAAQLRRAIDNRDADRVRELLAEIALHEGDPIWLAEFFQKLGPEDTLMALATIQDDPQAVQTFDTALANATNSPTWDPSFTKQLFDWSNHMDPFLNVGGLRTHLTTLLLQHGTYSEDFLTHAGDALLFEVHPPGFQQDTPFSTFMTALARNPSAAYDYLTGTLHGQPRTVHLLDIVNRADRTDFDADQSMASALDAAFGTAEGPDDLARRQALWEAIGAADWHQLPDAVRQDIATHIANHIEDFKGTGQDYSGLDASGKKWVHTMETLFTMAEMDDTGHIDPARYEQLKQAVEHYLAQEAPPPGTTDPGAWERWLNDVGTMTGLVALPRRKVGYTQAQIAAAQADLLSNVLDDIGAALPGDGPFLHQIKRSIADALAHVLAQSPGDPAGQDQLIMDVVKQQLTHYAAATLAANDPAFLPPSLRGKPLDSPDVQAYLTLAEQSVSDQSWPPDVVQAHPDWKPTFESNAGLLNTLRASVDQQLDSLFGTQG